MSPQYDRPGGRGQAGADRQAVERVRQALPLRSFQALDARYPEGRTFREIGAAEGLTGTPVGRIVAEGIDRARKALRGGLDC